jgi:hypothetical protein
MYTPWGDSDYCEQIHPGVYTVSTPGHGGIMVQRSVAKQQLSDRAITRGIDFGLYIAFEEDCDWALVAVEHPEWFVGHQIVPSNDENHTRLATQDEIEEAARDSVWRWNPDYFLAKYWTLHHHLCAYREIMSVARHQLGMDLTAAAKFTMKFNTLTPEEAKITYAFAMQFVARYGLCDCCARWTRETN